METSKFLLRSSTFKHVEIEPLSKLRENILATLAYYDVFDFPLKSEEIFGHLVNFKHIDKYMGIASYHADLRCLEIRVIQKELDRLILDGMIGLREGYYFLFNREYLLPLRLKREKNAQQKWRITKYAVWWLRFTPYVRAVFASGSLSMKNTDELSDLDVLIIVEHGRIWLTRLLITGLLSLLRVRRCGNDKIAPDKICLNHFITNRSFCIPHKSIYNAQTYTNLVPIFVVNRGLIEEFRLANSWVLGYVYNWDMAVQASQSSTSNSWERHALARVGEVLFNNRLGDWLEKIAKRHQSNRIAKNPVTTQSGGRVIYTDEQLEFHPHSIEIQIIKGYNERMLKLNLPLLAIEKNSGLN